MNLRIPKNTKDTIKTNLDVSISDKGEVLNYTPSFIKGDKVILKKEFSKYNTNHSKIVGKVCTVIKCNISNLGDMLVETLYFSKDNLIKNPYLAEHFERYIEDESSD